MIMNLKTSAILTTAALFAIALSTGHADARDRSGSFQTKKGTANYSQNIKREDKARTTNRTVTGPDGKAATTSKTTTKNETGGYSTIGTRTGYNGNTQTLNKSATRTDEGVAINKTVTSENGKSVTVDKTVTKDADGGYSTTGTYTTSGDKSGTISGSGQKTETGYAGTHTYINQDGKTVIVDEVYDHSAKSLTSTTTGPNGKVRTKIRQYNN